MRQLLPDPDCSTFMSIIYVCLCVLCFFQLRPTGLPNAIAHWPNITVHWSYVKMSCKTSTIIITQNSEAINIKIVSHKSSMTPPFFLTSKKQFIPPLCRYLCRDVSLAAVTTVLLLELARCRTWKMGRLISYWNLKTKSITRAYGWKLSRNEDKDHYRFIMTWRYTSAYVVMYIR